MRRQNASILCLLSNVGSNPFPVVPNCSWTLSFAREGSFNPRFWVCYWPGWHQLMCPKNLLCCSCTLCLKFSTCHLHLVIFHLLGNPTSLHNIKKVQELIPLTTDLSAYFQYARSWNPSLQLIWKPSFSPTNSSQITNLVSDQVTPPWSCCFYSSNNGLRPSISQMRSQPSLWVYLVLVIQSSLTNPYSPNSADGIPRPTPFITS